MPWSPLPAEMIWRQDPVRNWFRERSRDLPEHLLRTRDGDAVATYMTDGWKIEHQTRFSNRTTSMVLSRPVPGSAAPTEPLPRQWIAFPVVDALAVRGDGSTPPGQTWADLWVNAVKRCLVADSLEDLVQVLKQYGRTAMARNLLADDTVTGVAAARTLDALGGFDADRPDLLG